MAFPTVPSAADLKLHGHWASAFVHRVRLALKLKDLRYDYVEEDLSNKSPSLLEYNPVHKKVPVLVHQGRPIAESLVILEYIDEAWADKHPLLPRDPYDRAITRFWFHFFSNQLAASFMALMQNTGEELKAATQQYLSDLGLIEKELQQGFFKGRDFFGGEKMGVLDIILGCGSPWFPVIEETAGMKLLDGESFPRLSEVLHNIDEQDAVKEVFADKEKLVEWAKAARLRFLEAAINK